MVLRAVSGRCRHAAAADRDLEAGGSAYDSARGPHRRGDRSTDPGRAAARGQGPHLRRRGQSLDPARRGPPAGHPGRHAQGRAGARRPRRRLDRRPGARCRVAQRPRPHLRPGDPPRRPRGPTRYRRDGPRPPPRGDGADPGRRSARSIGPARDGVACCHACRTCRSGSRGVPSWPAASPRPLDPEPPEPLASAVLLERHGAVAVGADPDHAVNRLELVEVLCRTWRDALLIRAARASLAIVETPSPGS